MKHFALTLAVLCAASPSFASIVLVLGDDQSEDSVVPYLTGLGHSVNNPAVYYDWDPGDDADLTGYDAVLLLYGYDYGYTMTPNGSTAVTSYLQNGGHFIATAWAAYSGLDGDPVFDLSPVEYAGEYDYDAVWNIDETSPFFTGLSDGWSDGEGYERLSLIEPSAVALGSNQYGDPLVVYAENTNGGRFTYLNHSMSYSNGTVSSDALTLVGNAVSFSGAIPLPSTVLLLGIGIAALCLRRNSGNLLG